MVVTCAWPSIACTSDSGKARTATDPKQCRRSWKWTRRSVEAPKPGWESQFRLDEAGGVVRFRRTDLAEEIGFATYRTPAGDRLFEAIDQVSKELGYDD